MGVSFGVSRRFAAFLKALKCRDAMQGATPVATESSFVLLGIPALPAFVQLEQFSRIVTQSRFRVGGLYIESPRGLNPQFERWVGLLPRLERVRQTIVRFRLTIGRIVGV
jgi:hypothetical protein